jgi:DNA-directed RNA polymerase specialized sigma24 family protein
MAAPKTVLSANSFPTTQWTQVIEAIKSGSTESGNSALSAFCELYRPAIYQFFCRRGCGETEAEDYTQAFFVGRVLEPVAIGEGFLRKARRIEGQHFRSFLAHVLWQFLKDEQRKKSRVRTGGQAEHFTLNDPDHPLDVAEDVDFQRFGSEFDRVFALEIIQRAAERSRHSKYLIGHFRGEISQEEAAGKLGLEPNAFKQAYSNFRKRLAKDLWEEAAKLAGPDENEIRAEIKYLLSLFAETPP